MHSQARGGVHVRLEGDKKSRIIAGNSRIAVSVSDNHSQSRVMEGPSNELPACGRMEPDMRKMIVGGALTVAVAAGCQPQNKQDPNASASAVRPAALDVSAAPAGTPMYHPAPVRAIAVVPPAEPAVTQTPVLDAPAKVEAEKPAAKRWAKTTVARASHSSKAKASVASGDSYKVKKGDTLYAIAKAQYGDGKKWERIAAANPGLTPGTLRAGQTLTIPQ